MDKLTLTLASFMLLTLNADVSISAAEVNPVTAKWGKWQKLECLHKGWDQADTADVVKVNGVYQMWYGAHKNGLGFDGRWEICYATSKDGLNWTYHGSVFDLTDKVDNTHNTGCVDPTVLYFNGQYHMWYDWKLVGGYNKSGSNPDKQWKIGYATSPDGVKWTDHSDKLSFDPSMKNRFYKATHGLEPRVFYIDKNILWMYYNKRFNGDGSYRSVSTDGGLTWGPESKELKTVARCWDMFEYDGKYYMLFNHKKEGVGSIYIAESTDGVNWASEKVFLKGTYWIDSDAIYPVNSTEDFPCGISGPNAIKASQWALIHKKLTKNGAGRHMLGIVTTVSNTDSGGSGQPAERLSSEPPEPH